MNTPLERAEMAAAVALARADIPPDVQTLLLYGDGRGNVAPGVLRSAIAAALRAIREPTPEMLAAADSAIPRFEAEPNGTRLMGVDGAHDAWRAMIDVALER